MNLRRQSNKAYDTLAEKLRVDILAGRLKPGDAIQTETELAASFGISRNTVRKAVNILVGEGLLKKVQGSGTFVAQMDERLKGKASGAVQSRQILFLSMSSALSEECGRSVFLPIFENINKLLEKQSYSMLYSQLGLDCTPPVSLVKKDLCGVIFHGELPPSFWLDHIWPLPSVGLQYVNPEIDCNWVKIDNFSRSYQAVRYLKGLGHSRIGFLSNESELLMPRERFEGYLKAMAMYGLKVEQEWCITWQRPRCNGILLSERGDVDYWPYMQKAFDGTKPHPTALICLDDFRANFASAALAKHGFRVPEDVSILGARNDLRIFPLSFTGFNDRLDEICSEAVRILLAEVNGQGGVKGQTISLRPNFIPGRTAVSPASS